MDNSTQASSSRLKLSNPFKIDKKQNHLSCKTCDAIFEIPKYLGSPSQGKTKEWNTTVWAAHQLIEHHLEKKREN